MKKRGRALPENLKKKSPVLQHHLMFYWDSFWELGTNRSESGPIPGIAINDWCDRWDINTKEEYQEFLYYIREMDNVFLEVKSEEFKKKTSTGKAKTLNKGRR